MDPETESSAPRKDAGIGALAPCGPECSYARRLPDPGSDYIWCRRLGAVRLTGYGATDCRWFDPGTGSPDRQPAAGGDSE